jgi:hypothetical protein
MDKADFRNLVAILTEDVFLHVKDDPEIPDSQQRRSFVRSVFALVEGMTYASKQKILDKYGPKLSPAEIALITEESFDLDDGGTSKTRPLFLPLAKNVRFMFDLLIRFWEIPLEIKVGGPGWQGFLAAIQVRNRLTHPKQSSDLTVSDDDLKNVHAAYRWFSANHMLALSYKIKNHVKEVEESKVEIKKMIDMIASVNPEKAAELRSTIEKKPSEPSDSRRILSKQEVEQVFGMCLEALASL